MKLNANASKKRGAKKAPPVASKGKVPEIAIVAKLAPKKVAENSEQDIASDAATSAPEDSAQDIDTAAPAPAPKAPKKLSAGQSAAIAMLASRRK